MSAARRAGHCSAKSATAATESSTESMASACSSPPCVGCHDATITVAPVLAQLLGVRRSPDSGVSGRGGRGHLVHPGRVDTHGVEEGSSGLAGVALRVVRVHEALVAPVPGDAIPGEAITKTVRGQKRKERFGGRAAGQRYPKGS